LNYLEEYSEGEQEQIKHVDKETDWLDDTELEEQQCNLKTPPIEWGFLFVVNWKYISYFRKHGGLLYLNFNILEIYFQNMYYTSFRRQAPPLFKTYPNIQKKIFGKILGIWYVCKN
jgi:hypothetical protein